VFTLQLKVDSGVLHNNFRIIEQTTFRNAMQLGKADLNMDWAKEMHDQMQGTGARIC